MPMNMPRPSPFVIAEAVQAGLKIPAVQIDPRNNFVQGAFIFASDIDKMQMGFKSWRVPLAEVRDEIVIPSVRKNFEAEGRPKWIALKAATIKNRLYMGFPRGPILVRTGRLKRAATKKNIWELTSAVGREGYDMLKLRTTYLDQMAPYAEFHQLGARHVTRSLRGGGSNFYVSGLQAKITGQRATDIGTSYKSISDPTSTGGPLLPARPFIQLTVDEEAQIYTVFFAFMSRQVDKFWGPESRGLGL